MTTTEKTLAEMSIEDIIDRLRKIASARADTNYRFGRTGREWQKEAEVEWQAADALEAACRSEARFKSMGIQDSKALDLAIQARKRLDRHPERPDAWRTSVIQKVALDAMTFAAPDADELRAENERLRGALHPFADAARYLPAGEGDTITPSLSGFDLRRARAALTSGGGHE